MAASDFWRHCVSLTVEQAVWLMLDIDPPTHIGSASSHEPTGFAALFAALTSRIREGKLSATFRGTHIGDQPLGANSVDPDWRNTWVQTHDLKEWMRSIKLSPRVFFPDDSAVTAGNRSDDYKEYPSKLRAAIDANNAVRNLWYPDCGKSPRKALLDWLIPRAKDYGLVHPDNGRLNMKGIDEVVSVANWDPKGGAPKTRYGNKNTL